MRMTATSPAVPTGDHPDSETHAPRPTPSRAPDGARDDPAARIVIGVLVLSVAPARMYFEQQAELARFEHEAAVLERKNDALAARAEQLRDRAFLERLARQCLGMVKPGEVAFVVVPKEGAPAPPPEC